MQPAKSPKRSLKYEASDVLSIVYAESGQPGTNEAPSLRLKPEMIAVSGRSPPARATSMVRPLTRTPSTTGAQLHASRHGTDVTAPIDELTLSDWDRVMATNLRGPFVLTKAALTALKEGAGGSGGQVINIASTAARRAWPNASVYHASKFGLVGLSHALHAELRAQKVRVSTVLCGGMRTPFLLDRFPDIDASKLQDPMRVAEAVRFVASVPPESVIAEIMVLPVQETSWP